MRGKSRSRSSPRASKRKNEVETSSSEPKSKRTPKKTENEQKVDKYCWLCHTESNDKICVTCHRVYHTSCLEKAKASFSDLGVCPECQFQSVSGTELNSNRFLSLDKLKKMLDALTRRSYNKKKERKGIFLRWPEDDWDNLFKIIDFEILLDNINHVLPYTKTAEFYSDVKFIYHNACIAYGANSDEARAAENLRRDFKAELLDLEACPECYFYLYCDEVDRHDPFVRLCEFPHDIVWAQLTGHPYWPAKCLKVVKGVAHVRFFGEHEQSNIPIIKCLFMSENHPKLNSAPKSQKYKCAKRELLEYIQLYRWKYGNFKFYPHKTPYKPHEKQNEVAIHSTEGSCNRNSVQMKLEGNVNEDSEMYIINPRVVDDSEDNWSNQNGVINDIPAPNDNLNKNPSAVTSINMEFSADENNAHPVVPSSSPLNVAACNKKIEKFKDRERIPSGPEGTETVHSITVTNIASNSSAIHLNNFPIYTGNQTELDDEVHFIGQQRNVEANGNINPDVVLPVLMAENPVLESLIQEQRYMIDAMLVRFYAACAYKTGNLGNLNYIMGKMSKLRGDLKKCGSDLRKALEENEKFRKEDETNKYTIQKLNHTVNKLEAENRELQSNYQKEKERNTETVLNAKTVIDGIKKTYTTTLNEKDKHLQVAEEELKNLEEQIRCLKKEIEETKVENQRAEDELEATKKQISPDSISEYKRTHYCCVCEKSAGKTCCLNTSYCSLECEEKDAKDHRKRCGNKITSQSFVQQRVISQQSVVMVSHGVITSGRSHLNSPSVSQAVPEIDSTTISSPDRNPQIHRVSASPLLPTPHFHSSASSSRSYSSKSKRRSNR